MKALENVPMRGDWFGILCSTACAIHCAATPFLIALLPTVSAVSWLADPLFHQIAAVACCIMVMAAIVPGLHQHGDRRVAFSASIGIGLLLIAAFILPDRCCSGAPITISTTALATDTPDQCCVDQCCVDQCCAKSDAEGQSWSAEQGLKRLLGVTGANTVTSTQPYLSPLGGLFLVFAHFLNIRRRCCANGTCVSESTEKNNLL